MEMSIHTLDFNILTQPPKCLGHFILQLNKAKDSECEYCEWRNSFEIGVLRIYSLETIFEDCLF